MNVRLKGSIKTHRQPVYGIAPGQSKDTVFTCSSDGFIAEWNLNTLTQEKLTINMGTPVYSIFHDKENRRLYAGDSGGGLHRIDLISKTEERHLIYHQKGIFGITKNKTLNHLYVCGGDGKFTVWKASDMSLLRTFQFCDEKLRTVSVSADEKTICVGGNDGVAHLLETDFYNELHTLGEFPDGVSASCFSPCGDYLLLGFKDAHLMIFDRKNDYALIQRIPAHYFAIYDLKYSPSGKYFASCSRDKTVKIWDSKTFEVLQRIERPKLPGHTHSVNALLWKDDATLVSTGDDRTVLIWGK